MNIFFDAIDLIEKSNLLSGVQRELVCSLKLHQSQLHYQIPVEILSDPSKQWKRVALSMNELEFNETIESAPTDEVSISNLEDNTMIEETFSIAEQPIEIGSEPVQDTDLFIKIFNFKTYQEIQKVLEDLNLTTNSTNERNESQYNLILGPIKNEEADKLVSSFIMKGYKKIEIILE